MRKTRRPLIAGIALALVAVLGIGATLAWLTDETDEARNTFTVGDIEITLTETWNTDSDGDGKNDAWSADLIPGLTYAKDPVVSVEAGSEDCILFVQFKQVGQPSDYLTYTSTLTPANGWTQGTGNGVPENVWFRTVKKVDTERSWHLLDGDEVTVNANNVAEKSMDAAAQAELTYTAYAAQLYKSNYVEFSPAEAWDVVKPQ